MKKKLTGSPKAVDVAAHFNSDVCKNLSMIAVIYPFKVPPNNIHINQHNKTTFLFNEVISPKKTKTKTFKHVKAT